MGILEFSTAHRNAILDAIGEIFAGGTLAIYTGSRPGANETATGTLLVEIDLPDPCFAAASGSSMAKTGTWSGTAVASEAPGYARLVDAGGTQIREFDLAEAPGDGETLILDVLDFGWINEDDTVTIDTFVITQPGGDAV